MTLLTALKEKIETKELVKGKVEKLDKDAFVVMVEGIPAQCPVKKMADGFIHSKSNFIGKEFEFVVEKVAEENVTLSRIAALKIRDAEIINKAKEDWQANNPTYKGKVKKIMPYGVLVDLGGLTGLVPQAEIDFGRGKPGELVQVGQEVEVKITEWETRKGRPRITMSRKATLANPWKEVRSWKVGERRKGKVLREKEFGFFVEIAPGVEGLLRHEDRSWNGQEAMPVEIGAEIEVIMSSIDSRRQRIGLSTKFPENDPWAKVSAQFAPGTEIDAKVTALKSQGAELDLGDGHASFLPLRMIEKVHGAAYRKAFTPGNEVKVKVTKIDSRSRKIMVSLPQAMNDDGRDDYKQYLAKRKDQAKSKEEQVGSFGALLQQKLQKK